MFDRVMSPETTKASNLDLNVLGVRWEVRSVSKQIRVDKPEVVVVNMYNEVLVGLPWVPYCGSTGTLYDAARAAM